VGTNIPFVTTAELPFDEFDEVVAVCEFAVFVAGLSSVEDEHAPIVKIPARPIKLTTLLLIITPG